MKILALNPGSNTLRYKLVEVAKLGQATRILKEGSYDQVKEELTAQAARWAVEEAKEIGIEACAFRIVHGGVEFRKPVDLTSEVQAKLRALIPLAPLHLPTDLLVVNAVTQALPGVPAIAVFDTTFHHTLPDLAFRYALPDEKLPLLRRFGFHGIAHQYVSKAVSGLMGQSNLKIVSLHLGGGASACAICNGKSIDTSMGMTPLEGLIMSTRCGDIDPGVILWFLRQGKSIEEVDELLNQRSGLLGLSGRSADIRELEPAALDGDTQAEFALQSFAYRAKKYIGAYAAILNGVDAIVLSGALAENSPGIRKRALCNLEFFGIRIDQAKNSKAIATEMTDISTDDSLVRVWVIPADEERQIAEDAYQALGGS